MICIAGPPAMTLITTSIPAALTRPNRLRKSARARTKILAMRIVTNNEFEPANAAGKETNIRKKRAIVIRLPVRPRRNSSLSWKEAVLDGSGGEVSRYQKERSPVGFFSEVNRLDCSADSGFSELLMG